MDAVAPDQSVRIDLNDGELFREAVPHHLFRWLRENDPVYWNPSPDGGGFWNLTRYSDIVAASPNWQTFTTTHGTNIEDATGGYELALINQDPPLHTRLRGLVKQGFLPKMVRKLEPHIRDICTRILDQVAKKGECDFVTEISAELPLQVIAEMLGVPHEDRLKIFEWSNTMMGEFGHDPEKAKNAAIEMWAYTDALADERRSAPRDDLISILATCEIDGDRMTNAEMDIFFLLLAVAGNETTRNLISGGLLALTDYPEQRERLVTDLSLMPLAVEEMLRWVTPVMHFRRTATQDVEIRGKNIREGDKVLYWYVSGNRDADVFPNADTFDVTRQPNDHLAFGGGGPHFCIGFNLAQTEIRIMFEQLLTRFPDIELNGPIERWPINFVNSYKHIPVKFTPEKP